MLSVDEALRVVGHLLEHHPTTHASARDIRGVMVGAYDPAASCFCLTGALFLVATRFGLLSDRLALSAARLLIENITLAVELSPSGRLAAYWDRLGPGWRREAVEKLKRAGL